MKKEKARIKKINHQSKLGIVVSKKMAQTAIIEIERLKKHPYYHKRFKAHQRIAVQDENDKASTGDRIKIEECRPISKTKSWKIVEIIKSE